MNARRYGAWRHHEDGPVLFHFKDGLLHAIGF